MREFSNRYPQAAAKARVSKLGLPLLPRGRPHLAPSRPFLLHVGKRGAYKDFATVLRGIALLPDFDLIAAGGGPLKAHEQELISQLGLEHRVLAEPRPSDQRLADLLSATFVLVSASRAEGFGLPPLEAAAQGRPSVLTDIPVYRELHSGWSVFFPPGDPEALAAAVTTIAVNGMALPEPEHIARSFSWSSTARQTVEAYQAALP